MGKNNQPTQDQLILARSRLWTPELDKLLRRWKKQTGKRENGHISLSRRHNRFHYIFGIPTTILGAVVATGILATFKKCNECDDQNRPKCDADQWIRLTIGIISLFSTALVAFQTFMNYQEKAEKHKTAADDYGSLYRTLDTMLLVPGPVRGDPVATLQNIKSQYDDLVRRSPTLPKKYNVDFSYEVVETVKKEKNSPPLESNVESSFQNKEENTDGSTSSVDDIKKKIEEENAYDTSDEEREVCIGFDLDSAQSCDATAAALAAAEFTSRNNDQVQESLKRALDFELQRLEGHSRVPERRKKKTPEVIVEKTDDI